MDTVDSDVARTASSVATVLALATAASRRRAVRPTRPSRSTRVAAHARRLPVEGGVRCPSRPLAERLVRLLAYQWRRCLADGTGCADVRRRDRSHLHPRTADIGHTLRVTETATNRDGSAAATSSATGTVTALPTSGPAHRVPPTVAGSPVGRPPDGHERTWTGTTPIRFSYQWRRCSSTGGTRDETSVRSRVYRPSSGDVNRTLRVLVIARPGRHRRGALRPHCPDREGVVPCAAEPLPAEGSGAWPGRASGFRRPG